MAIPSDALYMLIADPMNLQAVGRVFKAKGRESSRSLPLLVPDIIAAEELAAEVTSRFYLLARHFWPGPLTIIVPAAAKVPLKVTGMTGRLGLRHSEAPAIQKLARSRWPPGHRNQRKHFRPANEPNGNRSFRFNGWRGGSRP